MASLKRRHEDSSYAPLQSEYSLRKEPQQSTRNVSSLSTENFNNYVAEEDRVHSPNSVMDNHTMFNPPRESKRTLSFASKRDTSYSEDSDPDAEKRVTIWNWREQRKLSGNSAPFKKNLRDYIRKHPDWEQYVGQDKDQITGKKLSAKKMKTPGPQDPDHPWYTNGGMPSSPSAARDSAPHTSSYGTRSTQSRLQESENRTQESKSSRVEQATLSINLELLQPFSIKLEDPAVVAKRRAAEVAARRESMAAEASPAEEDSDDTVAADALEMQRKEEEEQAAAWAAASEKVAAERAQKEAAEKKAAEEALAERRSAHSEVQGNVANSAMARIEAYRAKRRMLAT